MVRVHDSSGIFSSINHKTDRWTWGEDGICPQCIFDAQWFSLLNAGILVDMRKSPKEAVNIFVRRVR